MTSAPIARRRLLRLGLGLGLAPVAIGTAGGALAQTKADTHDGRGIEVPWVPTPDDAIDVMLKLARVGPADLVCDLGSGDGRIPIVAAKRFRARGLGIELDGQLVASAWRAAQREGVADRVRFIEGDMFATDFSAATVVTLYLLTHLNDRLRPVFLKMRPGTRIVAHNYGMNDWDADEVAFFDGTRALLWYVPAQVEGLWRVRWGAPGERDRQIGGALTLNLTQSYQKLRGELFIDNAPGRLREAEMRGDRIRFAAPDPRGTLWSFNGRVRGGLMRGYATDGSALRTFGGERAG